MRVYISILQEKEQAYRTETDPNLDPPDFTYNAPAPAPVFMAVMSVSFYP